MINLYLKSLKKDEKLRVTSYVFKQNTKVKTHGYGPNL